MDTVRLCAGCSRNFLAYASEAEFYCADCRKRKAANAKPVEKGQIVRHFDGPDAYKRYVVMSVDGETDITVRRLGFPDSPIFAARIGEMVQE